MAVVLDGVAGAELSAGRNMAGEPRDTLNFAGMRVAGDAVAPSAAGIDRAALYRRGALARSVLMAGAMRDGVRAGRAAHRAGRIAPRWSALASSDPAGRVSL